MNMSASQCGSGCESGWTLYLDQSSYSQKRCQKFSRSFRVEDEEQDLSMVSDASSGPRHYCQDYEECLDENGSFCSAPAPPEPAKKSSKNKKKIKEHGSNQQHSYLDDTASSPVVSFSKERSFNRFVGLFTRLLGYTYKGMPPFFQGKSAFHKKIGFLKSGKTSSKDSGGFQEGNWE
ncbi:protein SOB FIVE-LIKE 5 isoform X2 [Gossypium hirsutum]|uniref:Protein SOB FIVE-LIKE 5 isoform X2 n=1 Tax=Gossypium hirsutum TaxID=3635 RepID=A0ABM3A5H3_GOSHI|nr:protein SOB FIVE-LIKE 5 isoform X2 [Gossypium hirsutum]